MSLCLRAETDLKDDPYRRRRDGLPGIWKPSQSLVGRNWAIAFVVLLAGVAIGYTISVLVLRGASPHQTETEALVDRARLSAEIYSLKRQLDEARASLPKRPVRGFVFFGTMSEDGTNWLETPSLFFGRLAIPDEDAEIVADTTTPVFTRPPRPTISSTWVKQHTSGVLKQGDAVVVTSVVRRGRNVWLGFERSEAGGE